jgi:hypothetical protein
MLTAGQLYSLRERIDAGIGSDDSDECSDASEALETLIAEAEDAMSVTEALRDAIYDASKL